MIFINKKGEKLVNQATDYYTGATIVVPGNAGLIAPNTFTSLIGVATCDIRSSCGVHETMLISRDTLQNTLALFSTCGNRQIPYFIREGFRGAPVWIPELGFNNFFVVVNRRF